MAIRRHRMMEMLAWLAAAASATSARAAEPPATDRVFAESLFQDGRKLLETGRTDEACSKLAESQRLVPKLGTLLNLATCHEKQGRTATAWLEFTEARALARRANQGERAAYAEKHLEALSRRLSRVIVEVPRAAAGLEARIDGTLVGAPAWGTAIPIDPGRHELVLSAPGRRTHSEIFTAREGPAELRLIAPELARDTKPLPPPLAPVPTLPASANTPPRETKKIDRTVQRGIGIAFTTLGAVGLGMGSYFGIRTFSLKSKASAYCDGNACRESTGVELLKDAKAAATASTLSFALGVAASACGLVLILHSGVVHRRAWLAPGVGPGLALTATF